MDRRRNGITELSADSQRVRYSFGGETDFEPLRYGDAFVSELDPTGSKLLYSTYLGGSGPDAAFAVSVDGTGAAYVAGGTSSANFPTTAGALQAAYSGSASATFPTLAGNAFVTKFDSSGHVVYSTFVGTYGTEGTAIAVDTQGRAAINAPAASLMTQATNCTGQPTITVLNAAGSAVAAFSPVTGEYLAMDSKGGLYSAGTTRTLAFLSTPHAFQTRYGGGDSDGSAGKVDLSHVLHIARRGAQYYLPSITEQYSERLRRRAADVEFHLIDGGHRDYEGGEDRRPGRGRTRNTVAPILPVSSSRILA